MGVQFINTSQQEFLSKKYLYKYLPLENALKTLNYKYLWLANPSTWEDPFEKRFIEAIYCRPSKHKKSKNIKESFKWKKQVFCTCMTSNQSCEAYWRIYSKNTIGIRFRIYREQLLKILNAYSEQHPGYTIYLGKVEYWAKKDISKSSLNDIQSKIYPDNSTKSIINQDEFRARLLFLKRLSFKYEDEYRILVVKDRKTNESGIKLNYNINNTDLIYKILLDPHLEDETIKLLKDVFENKYNFMPTSTNDTRVNKSSLYDDKNPAFINL